MNLQYTINHPNLRNVKCNVNKVLVYVFNMLVNVAEIHVNDIKKAAVPKAGTAAF